MMASQGRHCVVADHLDLKYTPTGSSALFWQRLKKVRVVGLLFPVVYLFARYFSS